MQIPHKNAYCAMEVNLNSSAMSSICGIYCPGLLLSSSEKCKFWIDTRIVLIGNSKNYYWPNSLSLRGKKSLPFTMLIANQLAYRAKASRCLTAQGASQLKVPHSPLLNYRLPHYQGRTKTHTLHSTCSNYKMQYKSI